MIIKFPKNSKEQRILNAIARSLEKILPGLKGSVEFGFKNGQCMNVCIKGYIDIPKEYSNGY